MAANSKKRSRETKENNNKKKSMRYIYYIGTDRAFYKGRILHPILL